MMLLMIFLSSCNSHQLFCDISFEEDRCRCRCLSTESLEIADKEKCEKDWEKYFYGIPEVHPINYEVEACEGIGGFRVEEIAKDIIPMINEERAACEDRGTNANTF